MKCPECSKVFSDLRDICPSCHTDLRPFKTDNGLRISFPDTPYEELLSRVQKKSQKNEDDTGAGISRLINAIGYVTKQQEDAETEPLSTNTPVNPEQEESKLNVEISKELPEEPLRADEAHQEEEEPVEIQTPPDEDSAHREEGEEELSSEERESDRQIVEEVLTAAPESATQSEELKQWDLKEWFSEVTEIHYPRSEMPPEPTVSHTIPIIQKRVVTIEDVTEEIDAATDELYSLTEAHPESSEDELADSVSQFEDGVSQSDKKISSEQEPLSAQEVSLEQASFERESSIPPTPSEEPQDLSDTPLEEDSALEDEPETPKSPPPPIEDPGELWDVTLQEIRGSASTAAIEMHTYDFQDFTDREDIKVLLDVALDAVRNPEIEEVYEEAKHEAERHSIADSKRLEDILEKTKKAVEAPVYGLSGTKGASLSAESDLALESSDSPLLEATTAGTLRRVLAFLLDVLLLIFVSLSSAVIALQFTNPAILGRLLLVNEFSYDAVVLIEYTLMSGFALFFLVPLLTSFTLQSSAGQSLVGLQVISQNGKKPTAAQHFVRIFSFPLSVVLMWLVPFRKHRQLLHDSWSKTFTCVR